MDLFSPANGHRLQALSADTDKLSVTLDDGRTIRLPREWFAQIAVSSAVQRDAWETATVDRLSSLADLPGETGYLPQLHQGLAV